VIKRPDALSADVFGADGRRVARVRYGLRFRHPLDGLVRQYREFARSKAAERAGRDPADIRHTVFGVGATPCTTRTTPLHPDH
jgi:hypothetical protein